MKTPLQAGSPSNCLKKEHFCAAGVCYGIGTVIFDQLSPYLHFPGLDDDDFVVAPPTVDMPNRYVEIG